MLCPWILAISRGASQTFRGGLTMRSLRPKMPNGNPSLFLAEDIIGRTFICCVCLQEKAFSLLDIGASRPSHPHAIHRDICKHCISVGKFCPRCSTYKLFDRFPKGNNRGETASYCLLCKGKRNKENYDPQKQRENILRLRFKITQAEYDAMLIEQGGVCAICKQPETTRGGDRSGPRKDKVRPLSVDHNHATGKVRALLCNRCNRLVGLAEMKISNDVLEYIRKYSS